MPVVSKRASDLLNAHIGESEKAIARAFEEARNDGALLILDEVDSSSATAGMPYGRGKLLRSMNFSPS